MVSITTSKQFVGELVDRLRQDNYETTSAPNGSVFASRKTRTGTSLFYVVQVDGTAQTYQSLQKHIDIAYNSSAAEARRILGARQAVSEHAVYTVFVSDSPFRREAATDLSEFHQNRRIMGMYEIPILVETNPLSVKRMWPWQWFGLFMYLGFWRHSKKMLGA